MYSTFIEIFRCLTWAVEQYYPCSTAANVLVNYFTLSLPTATALQLLFEYWFFREGRNKTVVPDCTYAFNNVIFFSSLLLRFSLYSSPTTALTCVLQMLHFWKDTTSDGQMVWAAVHGYRHTTFFVLYPITYILLLVPIWFARTCPPRFQRCFVVMRQFSL